MKWRLIALAICIPLMAVITWIRINECVGADRPWWC